MSVRAYPLLDNAHAPVLGWTPRKALALPPQQQHHLILPGTQTAPRKP